MKLEKEFAYIHCLYITPPVLGKGYGKELLQLMIQAAIDAKLTTIRLESSLTAHKFYQSFGFVDSSPLKILEKLSSWRELGSAVHRLYVYQYKF